MTPVMVESGPIIIGSGVSGLTAALALGNCTVMTKTPSLWGGSTAWAQGGIAAAVGKMDTPGLHSADTMAVSGGTAEPPVVDILTGEGPEAVKRLISQGARFDRGSDGTLALGREAGHGRRRILHANGDSTGAEVSRALIAAVEARDDIEVVVDTFAVDLIIVDGEVAGVLAIAPDGRPLIYRSSAVVVATGGIGQVFERTTNPAEVTGDGIAMAIRAGVEMADLEFIQFHPTALDVDSPTMPLLTEALRGEGALLVDEDGRRFMIAIHPDAELAPRDVVARANWFELLAGNRPFLDATDVVGDAFPERFPTVFRAAMNHGLDPRVQPLAVSPAVHYFMGGIAVDAHGRSSLPGLWACGEASSTGVHGANRLASNSLLEGLVFGARVADSVAGTGRVARRIDTTSLAMPINSEGGGDAIAGIRRLMWRHAGIVRHRDGLVTLIEELDLIEPDSLIAQNALTVGRAIAECALARTESRGGHYRSDYPAPDPAQAIRSTYRVTGLGRILEGAA